MIRFTFASLHLARLARIHLAAETEHPALATAHVHLQITPDRLRFAATNGKLLAAIIVDTIDKANAGTDVLLDCSQFTAAIKALAKSTGAIRTPQVIHVEVGVGEVRFSHGQNSTIVRRIGLRFPAMDHIFTKPTGMRWVPCVATLDQDFASLAKRISGNPKPLLFLTPVPLASPAPQLWQQPTAKGSLPLVPVTDLEPLTRSAAFWADGDLFLLLMPIFRDAAEPQLNLTRFLLPVAQLETVAA